jgi:hypothetical protein
MISTWQLNGNGHSAALVADGWSATVDLRAPQQGLSVKLAGLTGNQAVVRILGVDFGEASPVDPTRIDAYVRGNDLVATYGEAAPLRLRSQIYWRWLPAAEFAPDLAEHVTVAFELVLSSNTSLLDSDPQSSVRSQVSFAEHANQLLKDQRAGLIAAKLEQAAGGELKHSETILPQTNGTGCLFIQIKGTPYSYVELVHPSDYQSSTVTLTSVAEPSGSEASIEHQVFHTRLEKGVILRARLRSALVAREKDEAIAIAAYQNFARTEPPLTV